MNICLSMKIVIKKCTWLYYIGTGLGPGFSGMSDPYLIVLKYSDPLNLILDPVLD